MDFATSCLDTLTENTRRGSCTQVIDALPQSVSDQSTRRSKNLCTKTLLARAIRSFFKKCAQLDRLRKARRAMGTLPSCSDAAAAAQCGQGFSVCSSEEDCMDEESDDGDAKSDCHPQDDVYGRASTASTRRRSTGTDGPVLEYSVRSSWSGDSSFENPVSTDARRRSGCLLFLSQPGHGDNPCRFSSERVITNSCVTGCWQRRARI